MKPKAYRHHFGGPLRFQPSCVFCGITGPEWHVENCYLTREQMDARPPCVLVLSFPHAVMADHLTFYLEAGA